MSTLSSTLLFSLFFFWSAKTFFLFFLFSRECFVKWFIFAMTTSLTQHWNHLMNPNELNEKIEKNNDTPFIVYLNCWIVFFVCEFFFFVCFFNNDLFHGNSLPIFLKLKFCVCIFIFCFFFSFFHSWVWSDSRQSTFDPYNNGNAKCSPIVPLFHSVQINGLLFSCLFFFLLILPATL